MVDDTGELKGKKLVGASTKKSHEETLTDFVDMLHVAYENLSYGPNGEEIEVKQSAMIEWMKFSKPTFIKYFNEAVKSEMTDLRRKTRNKKDGKATLITRVKEGVND